MNGILTRRIGMWVLALVLGALLLAGPAPAATRRPSRRAGKAKTQTQRKAAKTSPKPDRKASGKQAETAPANVAAKPAEAEAKPETPALPPLDLDRLIATALANNQELQARRKQIEAEQAKVPQARALPDPMIGVMANGLFAMGGGVEFQAKQMIMGAGKRRLMGEAAALSAQRVATDYAEKQRELTAEVKKAYYDLYLIDKSIEIALHNKGLLSDFVKLTQTKYSVGQGLQQDVLRAQVAQSRILDDLLMLHQQRTSAQARLNALLNLPPQSPLGPATVLTRHQVTLPEEALQQTALQQRPMLQGMQLMVAESEKMAELARRNLQPNYEVQVGVSPGGGMAGSGQTDVSVGVMLEVPLYHRTKQDKAIEQRGAETEAARSSYDAQKTMVFSMIRDGLAMLEMNDRQIDLYRNGIIPQAETSLESARAGYQVNKVDFLSLLDSQASLYNDLQTYYRALTDYEKTVAELEQTVGAPLGVSEATK